MRWLKSTVGILILVPTAGLTQESLCNPCVDPPLDRELLPRTDTQVLPEGAFNLGAATARLLRIRAQLLEAMALEEKRLDSDSDNAPEDAGSVQPSDDGGTTTE